MDGAAGATGATGPTGPTGATGPVGPEPWYAAGTTGPATRNWDDVYISGKVGIGIGTDLPRAALEVSSGDSGILFPSVDEADAAAPLPEGMMIYDPTSQAMKYWNGNNWVPITSNAGQVKINGYLPDDDPGTAPDYTQVTLSLPAPAGGNVVFVPIVFDTASGAGDVIDGELALSADPVTSWPANIPVPEQTDVYDFDTDRFLENPIPGQAHIWRIVMSYTKGTGNITFIVRLQNPDTGFTQDQLQTITGEGSVRDGTIVFNVLTIADAASIGRGYTFSVGAEDPATVTIQSVTRFSLQK